MLYPDFNELLEFAGRSARLKLRNRRRLEANHTGDYASAFLGQGLEFHEVREYRLGDDVRNIDWRVTARMERPYLKVFTEERERTVLLCVDANRSMRFGTRKTFKSVQAARATAVLGWMAQKAGDRLGVAIFGDVAKGLQFFIPQRGRRALWQALKLLSQRKEKSTETPLGLGDALTAIAKTAPTGGLIFVVSDFASLPADIEKHFANLRRKCEVILIRVDDPADGHLPAMDLIWFSDENNAKHLAATGDQKGRDAYLNSWRKSQLELEQIAAKYQIEIVGVHTNSDLLTDLVQGLQKINLRRRGRR